MKTLQEEINERRRAAIQRGVAVYVRQPFTEERVPGVVIERVRDEVLVAACGEEVLYGIHEVEKST